MPALWAILSSMILAAGPADSGRVVVYTALDAPFSKPILDDFERHSGLNVLAVYDTESTKTIGLVNRIRAEKNKPRCDVFWNNEIVNTIRLKQEGLLEACRPSQAAHYPAQYKDPGGCWYGFAARARVLIVNTERIPAGLEPTSIFDLTDPKWTGQIGLARPLFGTTASHIACLYAGLGADRANQWLDDLKANDVRIMSGNRACAQAVGKGLLSCALTDTDDAMIEICAHRPVRIVYLDTGPAQIGTLFLPNTLAVVKGCPNPQGARQLIDYLLSVPVEARLAAGPSAQIPLHQEFKGQTQVRTPRQIKALQVDFEQAARQFPLAAEHIKKQRLD